MIVIRRLTDRRRAYTGIFLPGEAPQIFPTSDHEHARIMQIYLQDRPYDGVENDSSDYGLNGIALKSVAFAPAPDAKKPAANSAAG